MLRLTVLSQSTDQVVLALDGWVAGPDVELLAQEGQQLLTSTQQLILDLEGVQSIDPAGIDLLHRWVAGGLVLRGGSSFMRHLLEKHGLVLQDEGLDSNH